MFGKALRILGLDGRMGIWVVEQDLYGNFCPSFLRATCGERKSKTMQIKFKKVEEIWGGKGKRMTAEVLLYSD